MWVLFAVPFAISTFVCLPPVSRFLVKNLVRFSPRIEHEGIQDALIAIEVTRSQTIELLYSVRLMILTYCFSLVLSIILATTLFPPSSLGLFLLTIPLIFLPFMLRLTNACLRRVNSSIGVLFLQLILSSLSSLVLAVAFGLRTLFHPLAFIIDVLSALKYSIFASGLVLDALIFPLRNLFNINAKKFIGGDTPLIIAAQAGNVQKVARLLEKRAQINLQSKEGDTALHRVIIATDISLDAKTRIITALLDSGADSQVLNAAQKTPLLNLNLIENDVERRALLQIFQQRNIVLPTEVLQYANRPRRTRSFNPAQSYDVFSVKKSANQSLAKLKNRYAHIDVDRTLDRLKTEFENEIKDLQDPTQKQWIKPARTTLCQIIDQKISYTETYSDPPSSISLKEALAYVWEGTCDKQALANTTLSDTEIKNRKVQFIQHLHECRRGYNLDNMGKDQGGKDQAICGHGHLVKMLSVLWHEHDDVNLVFITPESMTLKTQELVHQKFQALTPEMQNQYLPIWEKEGSIPEELLAILKPQVAAALHEEFDPYRDYINDSRGTGYHAILQGQIESIEYIKPRVVNLQTTLNAANTAGPLLLNMLKKNAPVNNQASVQTQNELPQTAPTARA